MLLVPMTLPCCHPCPRKAPSHPAQPPAGAGTGAERLFPRLCWISALCNNCLFADVRKRPAFPRGRLSALEIALPASETRVQQICAGAVQRQPFPFSFFISSLPLVPSQVLMGR